MAIICSAALVAAPAVAADRIGGPPAGDLFTIVRPVPMVVLGTATPSPQNSRAPAWWFPGVPQSWLACDGTDCVRAKPIAPIVLGHL
jgi:hypothetical protein